MSGTTSPAAAALAASLGLQPHPEGGFYRETYRAAETVTVAVDGQEPRQRSASTAILFLITPQNVSRLHRLASDEVWHFYQGSPMTVVELRAGGGLVKTVLGGGGGGGGGTFQHVVRAGTWFGSYGSGGPDDYSLVGCTVAPGFDFADFELASRARLLAEFVDAGPEAVVAVTRAEILRLTEGLP